MANKKKSVQPAQEEETAATETIDITDAPVKKEKKKAPKYSVGSIVFIRKDATADLNGFKLFPQYKKYTYTVEAYDEKSEVYSLRRLNLLLRLKETDLMAPNEKSGNALISKQY